jgi:hypothetical protein
MKRTFATVLSLISFLIAPAPAFALFTVPQGGTGWASFSSGALIYGNGANNLATTTAGTLGYVLQYNGTFPTWVATSSLGLVTHPAGNDKEIQFNDNGSFGSDSTLIWDKGSGTLTVSATANRGIKLNAADSAIYIGAAGSFSNTFITDNDGGALYLSGRASTTAVEMGTNDMAGNPVKFDLHLLGVNTRFVFPDGGGTFGIIEANQKWTGTNTFSKGTGTTTMTFGTLGDTSSKVCFNTKNSAGQDASFYINNDFQMVISPSLCQ